VIVVWKNQDNNSQKSGNNYGSNMAHQDSTLIFHVFHGKGKDDVEQHWFTYETTSSIKRIRDEETKIAQLETMFRDWDLTWYMKYKDTVPIGQAMSLADNNLIQVDHLKIR
jgi:hypothetical protein